MFSDLFNKRDEYQAHEHVGNMTLMHDKLDFKDEKGCNHGDTRQTDEKCKTCLCQGELLFLQIMVTIGIVSFVVFKDFRDEVVVGGHLEVDVYGVGDYEYNSCSATEISDPRGKLWANYCALVTTRGASSLGYDGGKRCWNNETHCGTLVTGKGNRPEQVYVLPAINIKLLPTSLTASWKTCSLRRMPPATKQKPMHSSRFARILPNIAARTTGMFLSPLATRTLKRMISISEPSVVSINTPSTLGIFLASS